MTGAPDAAVWLAAARERADAATDGPWDVWPAEGGAYEVFTHDGKHPVVCDDRYGDGLPGGPVESEADAAFIAAARADLPAALDGLAGVLELHRPCDLIAAGVWADLVRGTPEAVVCRECSSPDEWDAPYIYPDTHLVPWPCPTHQAITAALPAPGGTR